MPSLSDIPGKSLVTGATSRAKVAVGAGLGVVAIGGFVLRRVLRRGGGDGANADPIAEAPTSPPGADAVEPPVSPKPKPAKPKAPKSKPKADSKAPKPKPESKSKSATGKPAGEPKPAAKPKPPKSKSSPKAKAAPKSVPPKERTVPVPKPEPPPSEPGNHSADAEPHHALNNPVADPDETEYPDPFEKRSDPLDPPDPDGKPFGEEPHPQTGAESTSEPRALDDLEADERAQPPERDNLD